MSPLKFFGCLVIGGALVPLVIVASLYIEDAIARCLEILRSASVRRSGSTTVQGRARDVVPRPGE